MSGLSSDQQRSLDEKKAEIRMENEKYLRERPDLRLMTSVFLARVLESPEDEALLSSVRDEVADLCRDFPLYTERWNETD